MYTKLNPAENINELVSYLKVVDNDNYCYRGQTKHYDKILPSLYRNAIIDQNSINKKMWDIDSVEYQNRLKSEQSILKDRLRNMLIENLGRGVGNIVAQQYGLASETLDITEDISIAAFFATRKYPEYEHYEGDEANKLGVIYRFRKQDKIDSHEKLEYLLNGVGHFNSKIEKEVWFEKRYKIEDVEKEKLEEYFDKFGKEIVHLYTYPVIISFLQCKDFTFDAFKNTFKYAPRALMNSRLARQKGGFIRPSIHLKCTVPKKKEIFEKYYLLDRNYYFPETAFVNDVIGVSDIGSIPGIDIYYFKHSNVEITQINREFLWPSEIEDDIYEFLTNLCTNDERTIDYIDNENTFIDDIEKGIIDPGYKSLSIQTQQEALKYFQNGELNNAKRLFEDAISIDSNNSMCYNYLAIILQKNNELDDALEYYSKSIAINPYNWNTYINLSALFHEKGNLKKALENVEYALHLNDRRTETYLQKSIIQTELGEFNKAIESIKTGFNFISISGQGGMSRFQLSNELIIQLATCYYMLNDLENFNDTLNNFSGNIDKECFVTHLDRIKKNNCMCQIET
jgi:tetratricopeptide (TPR) repeat protein